MSGTEFIFGVVYAIIFAVIVYTAVQVVVFAFSGSIVATQTEVIGGVPAIGHMDTPITVFLAKYGVI